MSTKRNKALNPEASLKSMIKSGNDLLDNLKFEEALTKFKEAEKYMSQNFPTDNTKKRQLELQIDQGILCGSSFDYVNELIEKYKSKTMDLKMEQEFSYAVANALIYTKKFEQATEYLTKSMNFLEQFPKKDDDYEIKKAQLYGLWIEVAVNEKNKAKTIEYLEFAFGCKNVEKRDPSLYFFLLGCKRKHVEREEKKALSLK
uniref:Tetratricopeptide repeat protein n=1 Tax=Panagrolaimus sp. PS1159 TaxID=55785 RepID=A0AC35EVX0_9BILA